MKNNILLFVTEDLAVRRFKEDDAETLYGFSGQISHKEIPNDIFDSLEDTKRHLDIAIGNYRIEHLPVHYAIVLKKGNRLIGSIAFKRMEDYNIQVSIFIAEPYQNKGYGTQIAKAAAEFGKEHFAVDNIYACPRSVNEQAKKVFEKAGYALLDESEKEWFGEYQPVCRFEK